MQVIPAAIPSAPNPLSPQQAAALQAIWASSGSAKITLATGTLLWHGGTVANAARLSNTSALWCTKDPSKATSYDKWAVEDAKRNVVTAHRLELDVLQPLEMADFGCLSLQQFTIDHCNSSHDAMKAALQAWCLQSSFDGVVNLNRVESEVVICNPSTVLNVISVVDL